MCTLVRISHLSCSCPQTVRDDSTKYVSPSRLIAWQMVSRRERFTEAFRRRHQWLRRRSLPLTHRRSTTTKTNKNKIEYVYPERVGDGSSPAVSAPRQQLFTFAPPTVLSFSSRRRTFRRFFFVVSLNYLLQSKNAVVLICHHRLVGVVRVVRFPPRMTTILSICRHKQRAPRHMWMDGSMDGQTKEMTIVCVIVSWSLDTQRQTDALE